MMFKAETLDDALNDIMRRILAKGERISAGKGDAREFTGVLLKLSNPRARFSRTEGRGMLISFLGETLWYLSGSDKLDFIEYYIPQYRKYIKANSRAVRAPGAYGPRLFAGGEKSQISLLLKALREKQGKSDTRQAVAQIFDRVDLARASNDLPCTTTIQFLPRKAKLHVIATMRSNDVYRGFPGDVFAFTFIQEILARSLSIDVGIYSHFVGSLHLYNSDIDRAKNCINEGFQSPISMPPMPKGDPWPSLEWLLKTEQAVRTGLPRPSSTLIDPYWLDLARILEIKAAYSVKDMRRLIKIKEEMSSPIYNNFIRGRQVLLEKADVLQPVLPGIDVTVRENQT